MPSSRREYPSSMYPEVGSSYRSSGFGSDNGGGGERSARRSYDRTSDHHRDHRHRDDADGARSRRHRHSEDISRQDPRPSKDTHRSSSHHQDRNPNNTRDGRKSSESKARLWERVLPADFRPSQADPEERHHRLAKEKECEGFDWTPGIVLGLLGAAALFNHERSLVRRRKKDYIER